MNMNIKPTEQQTELCKKCQHAFMKCMDCVPVGVFKMSEYKKCKVIDISITVTEKFRVHLTGKYAWAVESGRFIGTEVEFAAHLAVMGAPEVECYESGSEGRKVVVN